LESLLQALVRSGLYTIRLGRFGQTYPGYVTICLAILPGACLLGSIGVLVGASWKPRVGIFRPSWAFSGRRIRDTSGLSCLMEVSRDHLEGFLGALRGHFGASWAFSVGDQADRTFSGYTGPPAFSTCPTLNAPPNVKCTSQR